MQRQIKEPEGRNENLGLLSATLAEPSHPDRFTPSAPAVPPQGTGSVWRWVRAGAGSMEMGTAGEMCWASVPKAGSRGMGFYC